MAKKASFTDECKIQLPSNEREYVRWPLEERNNEIDTTNAVKNGVNTDLCGVATNTMVVGNW